VQSLNTKIRIHVYGHESADPQSVADAFSGTYSQEPHSHSDLAIFVINPATGIDQQTIENWQALDEYQVPRVVVVTQLEKSEADFDDAVMLANRVFDQLITPFLVLHDDLGLPIALISLADLHIIDYSTTPPTITHSEEEHQTIVQEFREEYLEKFTSDGEGSFAAGLQFPAIPLWLEKGMGVDKVMDLINQIHV
jgi:hypothetical protein